MHFATVILCGADIGDGYSQGNKQSRVKVMRGAGPELGTNSLSEGGVERFSILPYPCAISWQ